MASNSMGTLLRFSTFGESHGTAIGGIIDGFPAGFKPDLDFVREQLQRRSTGKDASSSGRNESDEVEFLSGLYDGYTTGAPIAFLIRNKDARPGDYDNLKDVFRPSHADFTYQNKYGIRDHRGGGRSSARETTSWVVAGSICQQWLQEKGVEVIAYVSAIGGIEVPQDFAVTDRKSILSSRFACPHSPTDDQIGKYLDKLREAGDTAGGVITAKISKLPAGLGEPVFDKFHASLGKAMLSINAVKGFEIGEGFWAAEMRGSEHNDIPLEKDEKGGLITRENKAGGLLGGITNGEDVRFRVAFKAVASISQQQSTINKKGKKEIISVKGRHDACVVPRAVPIVESLAALVSADFYLQHQAYQSHQQQNPDLRG